jgi:hypothetical protein
MNINIRWILLAVLFPIFWIASCAGCQAAWSWEANDDEMLNTRRAIIYTMNDGGGYLAVRIDGMETCDQWWGYSPSQRTTDVSGLLYVRFASDPSAMWYYVIDSERRDLWTLDNDRYLEEGMSVAKVCAGRENVITRCCAEPWVKLQLRTDTWHYSIDSFDLNGFTAAYRAAMRYVAEDAEVSSYE